MDLRTLEGRSERHLERHFSGDTSVRVKAEEKPPAHATVKELQLLSALCELRFACVKRMRAYLPLNSKGQRRSIRGIQRSFVTLRNKKLVSWFRWVDTTTAGSGMSPLTTTPVYCLTTKGAERCILDRIIETDEHILTRTWRGRTSLHSVIPHQMGVVDIMSGLRLSARRSPDYEVVDMVPDFVFADVEGKSRIATIEMHGTSNEVRADLIARMRAKNLERDVTLYIELERKSKEQKKIIGKFENYGTLFSTGNRRFKDGPAVLLYVVTSSESIEDTNNRIKLVTSWVKNYPIAPAFRISHLNAVKENAFGNIWKKADGTPWRIGSDEKK